MKKDIQLRFFPVLLAALFGLSACAPQNTPAPSAEPAHWSYEGEAGPTHWGDLDPAYEACGKGKSQSPVDISAPNKSCA